LSQLLSLLDIFWLKLFYSTSSSEVEGPKEEEEMERGRARLT